MGFVIARLVLRLSFLFLIVSSIFYFYVLGYKISLNNDLVYKSAGIYDFLIFSKDDFFFLNNQKIYLVDHKVTLFSLYNGECGKIKISNFSAFVCFTKRSGKFVYIAPSLIKLSYLTDSYFKKLDFVCDLNSCNFKANNIKFQILDNQLFYYNGFNYVKMFNLKDFKVVGYKTNSLILLKNGKFYKLSWDI